MKGHIPCRTTSALIRNNLNLACKREREKRKKGRTWSFHNCKSYTDESKFELVFQCGIWMFPLVIFEATNFPFSHQASSSPQWRVVARYSSRESKCIADDRTSWAKMLAKSFSNESRPTVWWKSFDRTCHRWWNCTMPCRWSPSCSTSTWLLSKQVWLVSSFAARQAAILAENCHKGNSKTAHLPMSLWDDQYFQCYSCLSSIDSPHRHL